MEAKVLLAGESWVSSSTHFKGFDFFSSTYYATGAEYLIAALSSAGVNITHQPSHEAAKLFPLELNQLQRYDVIVLSDIGANTLLLSPEVFLEGKRVPNRLELIKEYVLEGGGLVMAGGYLVFRASTDRLVIIERQLRRYYRFPFWQPMTASRSRRV